MRDEGALRPWKNSDLKKKETYRVFGDKIAKYHPSSDGCNDSACQSSEAEEVTKTAHVNSEDKDDEAAVMTED